MSNLVAAPLRTVILAATGGGHRHCLVIEHQLRPLFAFLQAFSVPVGIYASQADFLDGERTTALVRSRIATAARQAVHLVQRQLPASHASASAPAVAVAWHTRILAR